MRHVGGRDGWPLTSLLGGPAEAGCVAEGRPSESWQVSQSLDQKVAIVGEKAQRVHVIREEALNKTATKGSSEVSLGAFLEGEKKSV